MKLLRKNKKAISFFSLISVFMIIIFLFLLVNYRAENIISTIQIKDFNSQIIKIDELNQIRIIDNLYKSENLKNLKTEILTSISDLSFLDNSKKLLRIQNGCSIYKNFNLKLFYDEREKNNFFDCKINFNDSEKIIQKIILEKKNKLILDSNLNLEINYDKNNNLYNLIGDYKLENTFEKQTNIFNQNINYKINLNNFEKLLKILNKIYEKITPENNLNNINCIKDISKNSKISDKNLFCIKKSIINLINEEDKNLLNNFNFNLDYITKNFKKNLPLKLIFIEKNTNDKISFGIILNYRPAFEIISFSLKNFELLDNTIKLEINKPKINFEEIKGFAVLYSNYNFFDKTNHNYGLLKNTLSNLNSQKDLTQIYLTKNKNQDNLNSDLTYYKFNNKNLKLNLITTNSKNFNSENKKSILLFQKFDYNQNKFVLFKSNKKIYFYVFAISDLNNFKNNLFDSNLVLNIENEKFIPPSSLVDSSLISINSNIKNSIKIKIPNLIYQDEKFNNYDIYLLNNLYDLTKTFNLIDCQNSNNCEYINGKINNFKTYNLDLILTSNNNLINPVSKIYKLKKIKLDTNKKYILKIIPVDKNGLGILNPINFKYDLIFNSNNNNYFISNGILNQIPFTRKNILIN